MRTRTNTRLWDVAVLSCAALAMALYTWGVTRTRALWSDEIFAWVMIHDPSWKHMVHAWVVSTDGGGLGFYVLARLWLDVFGSTEMSFRFFSTVGVFTAFAVLWVLLRKMYPPVLALTALTVVWFGNKLILWHMLQTRFYGLLLAFTAAAILLAVRSSEESARGTRRSTLLWVFIVNLLLLCSHPFGAVYSGLVLFGAVINDLLTGQRRWSYYVATTLPWSVLLLFLPELHNAAQVNKPWSWILYPHVADLLSAYTSEYLPALEILFWCMAAAVLVSMAWRSRRQETLLSLRAHRQTLLIGMLLLVFPVVLWVASRGKTSYFVDRYYCPYAIGMVIAGAEMLSLLFGTSLRGRRLWPRFAAATLLVVILLSVGPFAMVPYERGLILPQKDFTARLADKLPPGIPILILRVDVFDELVFYRNHHELQLLSPVDWPFALSMHAPKWAVPGMHEMENWRKVGYFSDQIVDLAPFLATHRHFVAVDSADTDWLAFHRRNQQWQVKRIGSFHQFPYDSDIYDVSVQVPAP